jgi:hypothetical protein
MKEPENIKCIYCNNLFSNKNILKSHQQNAKYCLVLQGKICKNEKSLNCNICNKTLSSKKNLENHIKICQKKDKNICQIFNCKYCNKILSNKQNLLLHQTICNTKIIIDNETLTKQNETLTKQNETLTKQNEIFNNEIKLLSKEIKKYNYQVKDLQNTIERLTIRAIDKPTTTNNTTNNILNISSTIDFNNVDDIKRIIDDDYDLNYAMNGQKGAARFLVDKFLKDENGNLKYICTDPSRHIFKFKNNKGEIKKDVEAKKLTNYIIDGGIRQKINEVLNDDVDKFDLISNPKTEIHNIKIDNNSFKKELASIIS